MPLVEEMAKELNTISHRVRIACGELDIPITDDDFVSEENYTGSLEGIKESIFVQEEPVREKREAMVDDG